MEGALLNPVDMPSHQEAVLEISGVLESISVVEVTMVFRKCYSGKAARVDEIQSETLKAQDNTPPYQHRCW